MAKFINPADTLYTWVRDCAADHQLEPAIEVQGTELSYEELLDLVDRLAARLVDAAGRPPRAVGLLASRSLAAYAGYLAALRCGAVVVPLNPRFPTVRNQSICRLSDVDVMVIDDEGMPQAAGVLSGTAIAPVTLLTGTGTPWSEELHARRWDGPVATDPGAVAYTLFTSGSTGAPKGVPIRHGNLGHYLAYYIDRYGVGPGSRLTQAFDLTFDPSVFDMFVTWCSGATLVVPQTEEILTPARFVVESRISHWFSVPSVVSIARRLRLLRPGCMPDLRWSLFCGEQLTLSQAEAWATAAPSSVIENLYGPTELTVSCLEYQLPADRAAWPTTSNATVPIGRACPHLEAVVLGADGAPSDDGELCVRGPQRFFGYLNPAENAGKFLDIVDGRGVAHEGLPTAGTWYRTGDRVRDEHGELVHLGRFDDQIKFHGYRVELGEIESALRRHPGIADVVVLAVNAADGEADLHAFHTGDPIDDADFPVLLADLPMYMRPRGFHYREQFPVNLNGKIDRKRLGAELAADIASPSGT